MPKRTWAYRLRKCRPRPYSKKSLNSSIMCPFVDSPPGRSSVPNSRTRQRADRNFQVSHFPWSGPRTGFSTLCDVAIYLCHEQPDLYVHEATVIDSRPGAVALSRSAFHPGGGGQVSDVGQIGWS